MSAAYLHNLNPWMFRFGDFGLTWYWFFYLVGFAAMAGWVKYSLLDQSLVTRGALIDLLLYGWLAILIGGRIGYFVFYQPDLVLQRPQLLPQIWLGGMSFHGAIILGGLTTWWVCLRHKLDFYMVTDRVLVFSPWVLALGRLGNFINGELWGRPSDLPWAVVFPLADQIPRHPSQLYEALGEGPLLAIVVVFAYKRWPGYGKASAVFLMAYATIRFGLEFFREPDRQLGFVLGPLSMGQILCIGFLGYGCFLFLKLQRHGNRQVI